MKKLIILILFTTLLFAESSKTDTFNPNKSDKKLAEFIKGVEYLSSENTLTHQNKIDWYKKLCEITGFTTAQAIKEIKKYDNSPKEWGQILKYSLSIVSDSLTIKKPDTTKKEITK